MSRIIARIVLAGMILWAGSAAAADGRGTVRLGYIFLDEEGNESVNYRTFNTYDGFLYSVEDLVYNLDNGIRIRADFKNITLDNRKIDFRLDRPRRYGLQFHHSDYRRVYSADGADNTRRKTVSGNAWVDPFSFLRVYGGLGNVNREGTARELFEIEGNNAGDQILLPHDYDLMSYHAGLRLHRHASMLQAEYRGQQFTDDLDSSRDQKRSRLRVNAALSHPSYNWILIYGGMQSYATEYEEAERELTSNSGWGGV
ncbi:MAG: hypothetical protein GF355_05250, partial [Candidatus Eisenbacteria bacterium]|nr:hypothetical protein [Candidatus Eisenbacteria bacterium]